MAEAARQTTQTEPARVKSTNGPGATDVEEDRIRLVAELNELIERTPGFSATSIARPHLGMSPSTLSQWMNGNYGGRVDRINESVRQFVARARAKAVLAPEVEVVETEVFLEIQGVLRLAHEIDGIAIVALRPGCGKSVAGRAFARLNRDVLHVQANGAWKSSQGMVAGIYRALTGEYRRDAYTHLVGPVIDELIRERRFLAINDAHNLGYDAIDLLCAIAEDAGVGFALLGHEILISEIAGIEAADAELWDRVRDRVFWCQPIPAFSKAEIRRIARQVLPDLTGDGLAVLCDTAWCDSLRAVVKTCKVARQMQLAGGGEADEALVKRAVALRVPKPGIPAVRRRKRAR